MYKDIVVCLDDEESRENTLRAAATFANEINASLTGLYTKITDVRGFPNYAYVTAELVQEATERENQRASEAKEMFLEMTNALACSATWLELESGENPNKVIAYADLVITNQAAYDARLGYSNIGFINDILLESGKPIILIPPAWDKVSFGSKILIGWDESRESVRALQDAMPLLKQAEHVDAVSVNYKDEQNVGDVSDITNYLTRRNVSNSFHLTETEGRLDTPEKVLLNYAKKMSSDLIVIGGYGHSRFREIILGGVTRFLVKKSNVPVLLSH